MRDPALEDIFARRGAITKIATELGISTAAVSQWKRVPDERVLDVARILGLAPTQLRPDLTEPPAPRPEPIRQSARMAFRRRRRTKVIATLGPASSTPEVIEKLYRGGADVFRLNFSTAATRPRRPHRHDSRRGTQGRPAHRHPGGRAGPKLRVGRFQAGRVQLQAGQPFRLDLNPSPGDVRRVNLPHKEIIAAAQIGTTLLLDDGKLRLRVTRTRPDHLETEVVVGGALSDRKGVNVPDVVLPIPALTEKDRADLDFVLPSASNTSACPSCSGRRTWPRRSASPMAAPG